MGNKHQGKGWERGREAGKSGRKDKEINWGQTGKIGLSGRRRKKKSSWKDCWLKGKRKKMKRPRQWGLLLCLSEVLQIPQGTQI